MNKPVAGDLRATQFVINMEQAFAAMSATNREPWSSEADRQVVRELLRELKQVAQCKLGDEENDGQASRSRP